MDNASDTRQIRAARKAAKALEAERATVIFTLMSSSAGRSYVHDWLVRSHVFQTSFSNDPYRTAFAEGERNAGLRLLTDVMSSAPDQYISMMREASDKEQADGRRNTDNDRHVGDNADAGRSDSGWPDDEVRSDYDERADLN